MINIAIFGASENYGGTEAYIMTLYKLLDQDKVQFDFLFHHLVKEIAYESDILSSGAKINKEYYMYSERHLAGYISPKDLFDRHPEWEGVYINVQKIDTTYRLLAEAARRKLPYRIIHAHNYDNRKKTLKDKLFKVWFKLTKQSIVTDYLACSQLAGENMFGKCDLTVIPNAIDFCKFAPNQNVREQMRERLKITENQAVIGFCGRLCYQKNPEKLIDIFADLHKRFTNSRLLILGDGEKREELKERVKNAGLFDSVFFAGTVTNVADWLQAMDCFLLPSRYEGFGIVLLEAQAAGLQCYTTKDVVPNETNITGRVKFIRGDAPPEKWAEEILSAGFERKNCLEILMKSDYTLSKMKEKLMKVFSMR